MAVRLRAPSSAATTTRSTSPGKGPAVIQPARAGSRSSTRRPRMAPPQGISSISPRLAASRSRADVLFASTGHVAAGGILAMFNEDAMDGLAMVAQNGGGSNDDHRRAEARLSGRGVWHRLAVDQCRSRRWNLFRVRHQPGHWTLHRRSVPLGRSLVQARDERPGHGDVVTVTGRTTSMRIRPTRAAHRDRWRSRSPTWIGSGLWGRRLAAGSRDSGRDRAHRNDA